MSKLELTKEDINEKIKEMYILQANLDEESVQKERKKFFKETLNVYGNWDKALRVNGISKRKLREREKFILYCILKQREEKYGPEALRPKNVHPEEMKDRIVNVYKTLKSLKDIISNWNEDKVLYEMHRHFLTGVKVEELEKKDEELHEQMMDHFKDMKDAIEKYDKRFGIPSILEGHEITVEDEEDETEEIPVFVSKPKTRIRNVKPTYVSTSDPLVDMMVKLNYIDNEGDAKAIVSASSIEKDEIIPFIFQTLAEAQMTGKKVTEKYIKEKNAPMYFAIKAHYHTLESALKTITSSLIAHS